MFPISRILPKSSKGAPLRVHKTVFARIEGFGRKNSNGTEKRESFQA